MFVAFHFSYCVYFLDRYFSRKLETTFSYFVTFRPSLVIGFEMDLGLRVRVMDLLITKDWLLRRLRGLGIEGKKVVELVMIYGSVRLEFMRLIPSNEQFIIFTFIMIKLISFLSYWRIINHQLPNILPLKLSLRINSLFSQKINNFLSLSANNKWAQTVPVVPANNLDHFLNHNFTKAVSLKSTAINSSWRAGSTLINSRLLRNFRLRRMSFVWVILLLK